MNNFENIPVDEYTTPCPYSVGELTGLDEILNLMKQEGIRHVPVVRDAKVVGVLSERDLKVVSNLQFAKKFVAEDLMIEDPYMVNYKAPMVEVVYEMSKRKIGSAIVVDDQSEIYGIFTVTDALNALIEIVRGTVE